MARIKQRSCWLQGQNLEERLLALRFFQSGSYPPVCYGKKCWGFDRVCEIHRCFSLPTSPRRKAGHRLMGHERTTASSDLQLVTDILVPSLDSYLKVSTDSSNKQGLGWLYLPKNIPSGVALLWKLSRQWFWLQSALWYNVTSVSPAFIRLPPLNGSTVCYVWYPKW